MQPSQLVLSLRRSLQVYSLDQWGLAESQMRMLFVLIPLLSALSNVRLESHSTTGPAVTIPRALHRRGAYAQVISGPLIGAFGLVGFTSIATISNLLFWVGCAVSYKAALIGATVGFLGGARTLGASTMMTAVGAKRGIPQARATRARPTQRAPAIDPSLPGRANCRATARTWWRSSR